jgi:hypothetical protein
MGVVRVLNFYSLEICLMCLLSNIVPGHRVRLSDKIASTLISLYTLWSGDQSHLTDYFIYKIISAIILNRSGIVVERPSIYLSLVYYMFSIALLSIEYKREITENIEFVTIIDLAYILSWLGNLSGFHLIISNLCILVSVLYYWIYRMINAGWCAWDGSRWCFIIIGHWVSRTMYYHLEIYKSLLVMEWEIRKIIFADD